MGTIIEDFAFFGIESDTAKGEYTGRTQEVASVIHHVIQNCNVNLSPFVPHSLDELVWQAREAGAMCALFIVSRTHRKEYIENLFKMLDSTVQQMEPRCLFWVADRESAEGKKVQAKNGVGGDMPSMLVLVPSYVPQCVEIFNGSNLDVGPVYASQIKKLRKRFLVEPPPLRASSYTHLLYKAQDPFKHMHAVQ